MSDKFTEAYFWTTQVLASLRASLEQHRFDEILPAILSERYEPGARHSIAVLGNRARPEIAVRSANGNPAPISVSGSKYFYLPVSHCVEKQLALEHMSRVYCIAPCLRLLMEGEDQSGRHLYTFFQAEIEWRTSSEEEVYGTIESLLSEFSNDLLRRLQRAGSLASDARARIEMLLRTPYERLAFSEARNRVRSVGGPVNPHAAADLTYAEEQALSQAAAAPFWLTDYPDGVRDCLYRQRPDGLFATYDLILPMGFGELATGGLRPDSADAILNQARKLGEEPHTHYVDWKRRTSIQTGGLGFGVERLVRYCAGAASILELRVAHDQGPNASIGVSPQVTAQHVTEHAA
jgi:asparaginyl-tRNA synthetase